MVRILSPDVTFIEKDLSEFAPSINSSVVGLVGFASKGPTNKATLITTPQNLLRTFGPPSESMVGQGIEGAMEILETTDQVYYVRASDDSMAADASATVAFGTMPAMQVIPSGIGVTRNAYFKVQVTNQNGTEQFASPRSYSVPSGTVSLGGYQGMALGKVFGSTLESNKVAGEWDEGTKAYGFLVGTYAGSGASITVSAYQDPGFVHDAAVLKALDANGDPSGLGTNVMTVWGTTLNTSGLSYVATSRYPGAGYNAGLKTNGDTSGNSVELDALGGINFNITVNEDGGAVENFKASLVANNNFIEDQIGTSEDNPQSDYIKGELFFSGMPATPVSPLLTSVTKWVNLGLLDGVEGSTRDIASQNPLTTKFNSRFAKLIEGTYNLAGGDNGIPASDTDRAVALIGSAALDPKTGMQALDDPVLNISLAAVPGITNQNVQNALIALAESTQEFLAVVSPPFGVGTAQDAIDWSNGLSESRTAAINNSYGTIMWPWLKVFSVFDQKSIWMDPAVYGIRQMTYTDNVAEPWFAAAGSNRGRLTKPTEVEVKTSKGDRDALYTGGNVINPIVAFPQRGIMIFGNKTTQRRASALQSTNVRRLMLSIRKLVINLAFDFLFEPNDEFTWERIENVVNPALDDIARRRGIVSIDGTPQYRVICDSTTNTPLRVDRGEMWCKILLKPTLTAENIVFEANLLGQGGSLGV